MQLKKRGSIQMSYSNLYNDIINRKEKISLIGLGYVGMPIAVSFSRKADVIGFDVNQAKIDLYKRGIDPTKEVGDEAIAICTVDFTADETRLKEAKFHIVAVPTPVNADHTPDLSPVIGASATLGRNLTKGSIVVYESTVYPGVTEEICIPILERESGLKCGVDFKIGYSPERINPGDKVHRLETIVKVVSGMDEESLNIIAKVYELVVEAGVHRAESIKVAEAAKVIENSQRDINIAFMNELAIIFNKMGIDTKAVLEAAGTKWNFLNFFPGLVGGHCIGIDPYYLTYKAEQLGYHSQIILSGRRINDDMGKYVAENTVKKMIQANKPIKGANVAILGITFKEDCPDSRNTKVIDIIKELKEYGVNVQVIDPVADAQEVEEEYGIHLNRLEDLRGVDAVIFAVAHKEFINLSLQEIKDWYRACPNHLFSAINEEVAATIENGCENNKNVLIDVKGIFDRKEAEGLDYLYWRL
jgi:UDP-N-acetyl-D-galactosamine dehydrogenase